MLSRLLRLLVVTALVSEAAAAAAAAAAATAAEAAVGVVPPLLFDVDGGGGLLSNIGLVEDLGQDVEDHEDKPAAEQRPAAFTAEELSRPRNVGVPSCCGGDVGDGEEHWETVSPGHQATNFTESVHDQREPLGPEWSNRDPRFRCC